MFAKKYFKVGISICIFFLAQAAFGATFYWNGGNTDWYDTTTPNANTGLNGNWYTDATFTTEAGALPGIFDEAVLEAGTAPIINLDSPFWLNPLRITSHTPTIDIEFQGVSFSNTITGELTASSVTFRGGNTNGAIINGDVYFYDTSLHAGTINGSAYFYDQSRSNGTVTVSENFYGNYDYNSAGPDLYIGMDKISTFPNPVKNLQPGVTITVGIGQSWNTTFGTMGFQDLGVDFIIEGSNTGTIGSLGNLVTFNGGTNSSAVLGNAHFNGGYNYGTIAGDAYFSCTALDFGIVSGTITHEPSGNCNQTLYWYKTGVDDNWSTLTGNWWLDAAHTQQSPFIPSSITPVIITGATPPSVTFGTWIQPASIDATGSSIIFNGIISSFNMPLTGDVIFNGTIPYSGTITGNATFNDSSYLGQAFPLALGGTVTGNATFNDNAYNYGTVVGSATYGNAVAGEMIVDIGRQWGCGTSGSNVSADNVTPIISWVFNADSSSCNILTGDVEFNGSTTNHATITGNVTFNGTSNNSIEGVINGNVIFNSSFFGPIPTTSNLIINNGVWSGIINGTVFSGDGITPISTFVFNNSTSSAASGTNIPGNVILNNSSFLRDTPVLGDVTYNTTYFGALATNGIMTISSNTFTPGTVLGTVYGSDALAITNYIFQNTTVLSQSGTIDGDAIFYNSSTNLGTINGNATFRNTSVSNSATINGNATFYDCSTNISTTITGVGQDLRNCGSGGGGVIIPNNITPQTDFTPPVISNFTIITTDRGAVFSFDTNENAKNVFSYVDYTQSQLSPNAISTPESPYQLRHTITIQGLRECTKYIYFFSVTDSAGNVTRHSINKSFTTTGCRTAAQNPQPPVPIIPKEISITQNVPKVQTAPLTQNSNSLNSQNKSSNNASGGVVLTPNPNTSLTSLCGNNTVEPGEVCDNGVDNGKPGMCRQDCQSMNPAVESSTVKDSLLASSTLNNNTNSDSDSHNGNENVGKSGNILPKSIRQALNNTFGEQQVTKTLIATQKAVEESVEDAIVVGKYTLAGATILLIGLFTAANFMLFSRKWTKYVVQPEDTLNSIAEKFGVYGDVFVKKNPHLLGTTLTPGSTIKLQDVHLFQKDYIHQLKFAWTDYFTHKKQVTPNV